MGVTETPKDNYLEGCSTIIVTPTALVWMLWMTIKCKNMKRHNVFFSISKILFFTNSITGVGSWRDHRHGDCKNLKNTALSILCQIYIHFCSFNAGCVACTLFGVYWFLSCVHLVPVYCCCTVRHYSPGWWEKDGRYQDGITKVELLTPICPLRHPGPENEMTSAQQKKVIIFLPFVTSIWWELFKINCWLKWIFHFSTNNFEKSRSLSTAI